VEPQIIMALVGTSALVLVVFMREILAPFLKSTQAIKVGHEPDQSTNTNIGKLFSVIHDFQVDTMGGLKDNKQDHDNLLTKVRRLEKWHEPNEAGQQTWKGTELALLVTRTNELLEDLLIEQKATNAELRGHKHPCAPAGQ